VLLVALTGGIASGKSVVAAIFREKGCFVQSADRLARDLMSPDRPAWKKLVARFGPAILNPDRTIDRGRFARLIFSDPEARRYVNGVVHPLVMAAKKRTVARLEREGRARIFVSEAALTIEAGYAGFFDKIVVVQCPPDLQARRLADRDGISPEEARQRIGAQMPAAEKVKHADYLIDASGTIPETIEQAERVCASLLQDEDLKRQSEGVSRRRKRRPGPRTRASRGSGGGKRCAG
jgi:dephospho-CoA kinase